ncbi:roadblock/LC7 domain-containing protein [Ottowia thiooxydans]|uniref:roadblock/LC7 domain-containing protein n=1 Tax=Ottowia thiooxydans TaxID=219182 RepID=UPI00056463DB|nr:roadblock/LC7 domain-containing protein [Ottowia thiooxydans]
MGKTFELPSSAKAFILQESERLLQEISGVSAVVVATVDGFDVGSAMKHGDPTRVAAMASSIFAISGVVSSEAHLGRSRSVTIDTDQGFVIVHSIYRDDADLVISVIAGEDAILGQVAYQVAQFAKNLAAA